MRFWHLVARLEHTTRRLLGRSVAAAMARPTWTHRTDAHPPAPFVQPGRYDSAGLRALLAIVHRRSVDSQTHRAHPIGADYRRRRRAPHFRVWAPAARRVDVVFDGRTGGRAERGGRRLFQRSSSTAGPGGRYQFRLDQADDAVSRSGLALPARGPHGPSEVVDPRRSRGPTGVARRADRRAGDLRAARRHVHAGRARGRRPTRELPELARDRHHRRSS